MIIKIEVEDYNIDEIMAVGAKDLKEHFLPKIGIHASEVFIQHIEPEENEKRMMGELYEHFWERA